MTEPISYRRGDVVLVNLAFVSSPTEQKVRPAVIIQNDVGNRFSANVIVAGISSQLPRRQYPTNLLLKLGSHEARGSGLDRDSVVQAEALTTISKRTVLRLIGHLNPRAMSAVDDCLRVSLGLD